MPLTHRHLKAETRFRELLADAELPAPDTVQYEVDEVVFLWHDTKVAVVVELDDRGDISSPRG